MRIREANSNSDSTTAHRLKNEFEAEQAEIYANWEAEKKQLSDRLSEQEEEIKDLQNKIDELATVKEDEVKSAIFLASKSQKEEVSK